MPLDPTMATIESMAVHHDLRGQAVMRARHIQRPSANCRAAWWTLPSSEPIKLSSIRCVNTSLHFIHSILETAGDVYVNHEGSHPLFFYDDFLREVN